jgi:hypothetical protein
MDPNRAILMIAYTTKVATTAIIEGNNTFLISKPYLYIIKKGAMTKKDIAVSLLKNAITRFTIAKRRNRIFLVSIYFMMFSMDIIPNNIHIISSLDLILATTSVWIGWSAKSNTIKNLIGLE